MRPLRAGGGKSNLSERCPVGRSTRSIRAIAFSLLCAWRAFVPYRNRSTNRWRWASSSCWRSNAPACAAIRSAFTRRQLRVGALLVAAPAAVDLEHAGRHRFEEPAVVRHEHDPGVQRSQMVLEPLDRVGVEVVGGLVEEQRRRARRPARGRATRASARRPRTCAAAGRGRPARTPGRARPPRAASATRSRPRARTRAGRCRSGEGRRRWGARPSAPRARAARPRAAPPSRLRRRRTSPSVSVPGERRALVVQGDARPRRHRDLAPVGRELAGQDAQERRLAGAVSADERDPVAGAQDGRDVGRAPRPRRTRAPRR